MRLRGGYLSYVLLILEIVVWWNHIAVATKLWLKLPKQLIGWLENVRNFRKFSLISRSFCKFTVDV